FFTGFWILLRILIDAYNVQVAAFNKDMATNEIVFFTLWNLIKLDAGAGLGALFERVQCFLRNFGATIEVCLRPRLYTLWLWSFSMHGVLPSTRSHLLRLLPCYPPYDMSSQRSVRASP